MIPKVSGVRLPKILAGEKNGSKVLEWNFKEPNIKWFEGGKLNITENCLDRHLEKNANTPAIIWEPNDPEEHHGFLPIANCIIKSPVCTRSKK